MCVCVYDEPQRAMTHPHVYPHRHVCPRQTLPTHVRPAHRAHIVYSQSHEHAQTERNLIMNAQLHGLSVSRFVVSLVGFLAPLLIDFVRSSFLEAGLGSWFLCLLSLHLRLV